MGSKRNPNRMSLVLHLPAPHAPRPPKPNLSQLEPNAASGPARDDRRETLDRSRTYAEPPSDPLREGGGGNRKNRGGGSPCTKQVTPVTRNVTPNASELHTREKT